MVHETLTGVMEQLEFNHQVGSSTRNFALLEFKNVLY